MFSPQWKAIPLIAQGLLKPAAMSRTLKGPVLVCNGSLPDAIPILAQLVGVDDMPTKINNPKPAITRLVLEPEELIAINWRGDHD